MDNKDLENIDKTPLARVLLLSKNIHRSSYMVRLIAGIYLLYLVYQLFSESESGLTTFSIVAVVLMTIAGIHFIISSGYALGKGIYAENFQSPETEEVQAEDGTVLDHIPTAEEIDAKAAQDRANEDA